jgi:tetratricopeptide (TPR) repeat protein
MKIKIISLFALSVLVVSCSTPAAPEYDPLPGYYQEVSRGWGFLGQENYSLAATNFRTAIKADLEDAQSEAYVGLAWSLALQDSLAKAVNNYQAALLREPESPKPLVYVLSGLSFCYRDLEPPDYEAVRDNALAALELSPGFVFDYKTSINSQDLEAVLAEAYFNLGKYDSAAVYADPNGSLDSTAADYQEDLLSKINLLITLSREGD